LAKTALSLDTARGGCLEFLAIRSDADRGSRPTDADKDVAARFTHYREVAEAIRALGPLLKHSEAVDDLRLLAARYEKLAHYLEGRPATLDGGKVLALRPRPSGAC
jgi:hypothetical protein